MRAKRSHVLTAMLAAAAFGLATAAVPVTATAQSSDSGQQAQQAPDYSDQKLRAFATAWLEIRDLLGKWKPKIDEAKKSGDNAKAKEIAKQANAELISTVQDTSGITLDEYKQITQQARQNEQLYQRISKIVKTMDEEQG